MKYLIITMIVFTPAFVYAQGTASTTVEKQQVLRYAEQMPEADYDVNAYIQENIQYPTEAIKEKQQGRIITDFVVTAEGGFTNISVRKSGIYPSLSKEAIRLIQTMPKWKPAMQNGKPVNVAYSLPIIFRLPK